jgi:thiol-disulfide isomerase/thioredoxin
MRQRNQDKRTVLIIQNDNNLINFLRMDGPKCVILHNSSDFCSTIPWETITGDSEVPIGTVSFPDLDNEKIRKYLVKIDEYKDKLPVLILATGDEMSMFWKPITNIFDILSHTLLKPMVKKFMVSKDTIVYIGASFCSPCRKIMQRIPELRKFFNYLDFFKVDFDNSPELVESFGVDIIPTFCLIRKGTDQPILKFQNSDFNLIKEKISEWISPKSLSLNEEF